MELTKHKIEPKLEDSLLVGRLIEKDKKLVADLAENLVKLKHVLMNVKEKRKENVTSIKQVYNVCERLKKSIIAEKAEMQHLFICFEEHIYVYQCRSK